VAVRPVKEIAVKDQMKIYRAKTFKADSPWGAVEVANMNGITTRLHWSDEPYHWHTNDGEEIFIVVDGVVEMHYKRSGTTEVARLTTGDIFYASVGTEHVAHPLGEARIVVVEQEGSE